MLSNRFIVLVVASIATLVIATPTAPEPDVPGDVVVACQDINLTGICATVAFVENICVQLPSSQVNQMSSVQVPADWACTFYESVLLGVIIRVLGLTECYSLRGSISCDAQTSPNTLLLAPGSSDLRLQNFNDVADSSICNQLCVVVIIIKIVVIVIVEPQYTVSF
ncbi:hypothetical protein GGX14DRAFT_395625 [Mycena pura]|uniref:Hydrophobin n=1 Tax=Mycena pura TaxID=153505 RepID=A0AAD6VGG3_9AGAR|nr:hypothetical protein GGX14DRAFT_395625 [Mycena pura]